MSALPICAANYLPLTRQFKLPKLFETGHYTKLPTRVTIKLAPSSNPMVVVVHNESPAARPQKHSHIKSTCPKRAVSCSTLAHYMTAAYMSSIHTPHIIGPDLSCYHLVYQLPTASTSNLRVPVPNVCHVTMQTRMSWLAHFIEEMDVGFSLESAQCQILG